MALSHSGVAVHVVAQTRKEAGRRGEWRVRVIRGRRQCWWPAVTPSRWRMRWPGGGSGEGEERKRKGEGKEADEVTWVVAGRAPLVTGKGSGKRVKAAEKKTMEEKTSSG